MKAEIRIKIGNTISPKEREEIVERIEELLREKFPPEKCFNCYKIEQFNP